MTKAELRLLATNAVLTHKVTSVAAYKPRQSRVIAVIDGKHEVRNERVRKTGGDGTRRGEILTGCYAPAGQVTIVKR